MPYSFRNGSWFASMLRYPKEARIVVSDVRRTRRHFDYSGDTSQYVDFGPRQLHWNGCGPCTIRDGQKMRQSTRAR
jgi:hypothetical protein